MKIRNGFVSNSSSSSFVIKLPEKIETKESLLKYLDGSILNYFSFPANEIVESIFGNIRTFNQEFDIDKICKYILGVDDCEYVSEIYTAGYCGDVSGWLSDKNINPEELMKKSFKEIVSEYFSNGDYFRYIISYSDDFEFSSMMEHRVMSKIFGKYLEEIINEH